jgi:hypothetical protein
VLGGGGYLLWQALTANSLSLLMIGATVRSTGWRCWSGASSN